MLQERCAVINLGYPRGRAAAADVFPWVEPAASLSEAIAAWPTAVIVTEWPEFSHMDPSTLDLDHLIDLRNVHAPADFEDTRILCISVGRSPSVLR